jgi:hypothetical protein
LFQNGHLLLGRQVFKGLNEPVHELLGFLYGWLIHLLALLSKGCGHAYKGVGYFLSHHCPYVVAG